MNGGTDGDAGHRVPWLGRERELRDGDSHSEVGRRLSVVAERGPRAGPAGLVDRARLPVVSGIVAQARQRGRRDPTVRDRRTRAARTVLERRADRLGLDIEPQLIARIGVGHRRLEDHGPPRGRPAHRDHGLAVALELAEHGRGIGWDRNRRPEVGSGFRVPAKRRPGARAAGLIQRARLPVICRVVREPGRGDERGLPVRHAAAGRGGRAGECRAHRLELDLQPERIAHVGIGQEAAQHNGPFTGGIADRDGRDRVRAQLCERLNAGGHPRVGDTEREHPRLPRARRGGLDPIRPRHGQALVAEAGVGSTGAAVVGRKRWGGIARRAVEGDVGVERGRRHHNRDRVARGGGEGVQARETGSAVRRRAVGRRE